MRARNGGMGNRNAVSLPPVTKFQAAKVGLVPYIQFSRIFKNDNLVKTVTLFKASFGLDCNKISNLKQ